MHYYHVRHCVNDSALGPLDGSCNSSRVFAHRSFCRRSGSGLWLCRSVNPERSFDCLMVVSPQNGDATYHLLVLRLLPTAHFVDFKIVAMEMTKHAEEAGFKVFCSHILIFGHGLGGRR